MRAGARRAAVESESLGSGIYSHEKLGEYGADLGFLSLDDAAEGACMHPRMRFEIRSFRELGADGQARCRAIRRYLQPPRQWRPAQESLTFRSSLG